MHNINRTPEYREVYVTHLSNKVESRCDPIVKDHVIIGFSRKPSSRKAGVHYFFREKQEPFNRTPRDGEILDLYKARMKLPRVPHKIRHNSPLNRPDKKVDRVQKARESSSNGEVKQSWSDEYCERMAIRLAEKHHIAD